MTFFRDLIADLITKKLWPVAMLLITAIIAIPSKLSKNESGGGVNPAAEAAAKRAAQEVAATEPVVSLVSDDAGHRSSVRGLAAHDPFADPHAKSGKHGDSAGAGTSSASSTAGSGGSGGSGGGGGTGDAGAAPTPAPSPSPSPAPQAPSTKSHSTYHVDLTFGMLGDEKHKPDLPRLTPLPSSSDPIVIFMGVLRDGETAVFMITADATPRPGDRCHESQGHIAAAENCSYVYLKAGETETFEVNDGLGIAQYRLHVRHVRKSSVGTAARASAANARESRVGREILRMEIPQLGTLRYSRATGTLYRING